MTVPNEHNAQFRFNEDSWETRCSCGWTSTGYAYRVEAEQACEKHVRDEESKIL